MFHSYPDPYSYTNAHPNPNKYHDRDINPYCNTYPNIDSNDSAY